MSVTTEKIVVSNVPKGVRPDAASSIKRPLTAPAKQKTHCPREPLLVAGPETDVPSKACGKGDGSSVTSAGSKNSRGSSTGDNSTKEKAGSKKAKGGVEAPPGTSPLGAGPTGAAPNKVAQRTGDRTLISTAYGGDLGEHVAPQFEWKRGWTSHTHPDLADVRTAQTYMMLQNFATQLGRLRHSGKAYHIYDIGGSAGFAERAEKFFAEKRLNVRVWTSRPIIDSNDAARSQDLESRYDQVCDCALGDSKRAEAFGGFCCQKYQAFTAAASSQLLCVVSVHTFYYLQTPDCIGELREMVERSVFKKTYHIVHPIFGGSGEIAEGSWDTKGGLVHFRITDSLKPYIHPPVQNGGFWVGDRPAVKRVVAPVEYRDEEDGIAEPLVPEAIDGMNARLAVIAERELRPQGREHDPSMELGLAGDLEMPIKLASGKTASLVLVLVASSRKRERPEFGRFPIPMGFVPWRGGYLVDKIMGYTLTSGRLSVFGPEHVDAELDVNLVHAKPVEVATVNYDNVVRSITSALEPHKLLEAEARITFLEARLCIALKQSNAEVTGDSARLWLVLLDLVTTAVTQLLVQRTELVSNHVRHEPPEVKEPRWTNTIFSPILERRKIVLPGMSNASMMAAAAVLLFLILSVVAIRFVAPMWSVEGMETFGRRGPVGDRVANHATFMDMVKDSVKTETLNNALARAQNATMDFAKTFAQSTVTLKKTKTKTEETVAVGSSAVPWWAEFLASYPTQSPFTDSVYVEEEQRTEQQPAPGRRRLLSVGGDDLLQETGAGVFAEVVFIATEGATDYRGYVRAGAEFMAEHGGLKLLAFTSCALFGWLVIQLYIGVRVSQFISNQLGLGTIRNWLAVLSFVAGVTLLWSAWESDVEMTDKRVTVGGVLTYYGLWFIAYFIGEMIALFIFDTLGLAKLVVAGGFAFLFTGVVGSGITYAYAVPDGGQVSVVDELLAALPCALSVLIALSRTTRGRLRSTKTVCVSRREYNRRQVRQTLGRNPRNLSLKYRSFVEPETMEEFKLRRGCLSGVGSVCVDGKEFIPIVGANSGPNLAVAVEERISKLQPGMATSGRSEYLGRRWADVRRWMEVSGLLAHWQNTPLPDPLVAEWWEKQLPSRRATMLPAVIRLFGSLELFTAHRCSEVCADLSDKEWRTVLRTELFVKREATIKSVGGYKPRAIQNPTPESKILLGPHTFRVDKWMKQVFAVDAETCYAGGLNGEAVGSFVENAIERMGCPIFLENDMSCFEGSITAEALETEAWLWEKLGASPFMMEFMRRDVRQDGVARGCFAYSILGGRKSGRNNTSCGNSALNAMATLYTLHLVADEPDTTYIGQGGYVSDVIGTENWSRYETYQKTQTVLERSRSIFMGDDNLIVVDAGLFGSHQALVRSGKIGGGSSLNDYFGQAFVSIFGKLGFNSTMKVSDRYSEVSFCGCHFVHTEAGILPAPIFPRQMLKMSWCTSNSETSDYWAWLRGVAGQLVTAVSHVPIMRIYLLKLSLLTNLEETEAQPYKPWVQTINAATERGMYDFCDFYKTVPSVVEDAERQLASWDPSSPIDISFINEEVTRFADLGEVYEPPTVDLESPQ